VQQLVFLFPSCSHSGPSKQAGAQNDPPIFSGGAIPLSCREVRTNKKIFEVVFSREAWVHCRQGWILRRRAGEPIASFATREEAVERGRETCRANWPCKLKVARRPVAETGI
jgi:hypothetical protein